MRTYSHAALTYAALRLTNHDRQAALLAALGATLPDLPVALGAAWLLKRKLTASRRDFDAEVCGRGVFRVPDAAAHSFPALLAASLAGGKTGAGRAFLLGWAGHLVADFLTHASDARPQLWPLSRWRFRSRISYRERSRHAGPVTAAEHALLFAAVLYALRDAGG